MVEPETGLLVLSKGTEELVSLFVGMAVFS